MTKVNLTNDTRTQRRPSPETAAPPGDQPPAIKREEMEPTVLGYAGPLIVPQEDLGADIDDGEDLDLGALQLKKVRRPHRREWIALNPALGISTHLLPRHVGPNEIETIYYYVTPEIRGPIRDEIRAVRVYPYWSFAARCVGLWVVHVTPDNSWYESLVPLFQRPADFYAQHAFRVRAERQLGRYQVKYKPVPSPVRWPDQPTEALLGEALGPARFITSPSHPIYLELTEGVDLG